MFTSPCEYRDLLISGVGIEHELLVELAKQSFAKNPVWLEDTASIQKSMERDLSIAQYTGGKVEVTASFFTLFRNSLNPCALCNKFVKLKATFMLGHFKTFLC